MENNNKKNRKVFLLSAKKIIEIAFTFFKTLRIFAVDATLNEGVCLCSYLSLLFSYVDSFFLPLFYFFLVRTLFRYVFFFFVYGPLVLHRTTVA